MKIMHVGLALAVVLASASPGVASAVADGPDGAEGFAVSSFAKSSESDIAVDGRIYPADVIDPAPAPPPVDPAPVSPDNPAPPPDDPTPDPPDNPASTPDSPSSSPEGAPDNTPAEPASGSLSPANPSATVASSAPSTGAETTAAPRAGDTEDNAPVTPDGNRVVSRVCSIADRITESVANAGAGLIDIINSSADTPPLSGEAVPAKSFALINLISAVAGAALFVSARIYAAKRRREEYGGEGRYTLRELPTLIATAMGVALLALTQDVTMPITLTDRFTIVQVAILAAVVVCFLAGTMKRSGAAGEKAE
jgi:uncharacterized membrane protein